MKVLLADDDRIALEMLTRQFRALGYDVVTATDGEDAWAKFQNASVSMVITDWMMPRMDGLELVRRIRSQAAAQYVYCILLTVRAHLTDLVSGMEAGADDFLTKPFDPNELRVRLAAGKRIIELERKLSDSNRRMKKDLEAAARIQHSLLPANLPNFRRHRFAWTYRPCDELGGDILNVVSLGPDHVALYLLDVAGHGVPAALLSVALSRLLTTAANSPSIIRDIEPAGTYRIVEPAEVLSRLNNTFSEDLEEGRFFTVLYGVLDLNGHSFHYASGGHNPALLLGSDGRVSKLAATGPPVGATEDATYEQLEAMLQPRDRLLVYSDGITEAQNGEGVYFGLERLIEIVKTPSTSPMQTVLDNLVTELEEWTYPNGLHDDVSCLFAEVAE